MATRKTGTTKSSKPAKPVEPAEDKAAMTDEATEAAAEGKPAEVIIAKVVHRFRDKDTLSTFQPGATIAVSPERFEEICAAGDFLERIQ